MTRNEKVDLAESILQEVCKQTASQIRDKVKKRLQLECPDVKIVTPRPSYPHASSWGAKVTDFPKCDPSTIAYTYILPLFVLEVPNP